MAMNPMERKSRNSLLIGILIGTLIMGLVAGLLGVMLVKLKGEENERIAAQKTVYVAKADIKSGDSVTIDMFSTVTADGNVTPKNALTMAAFNALSLTQDANGNEKTIEVKSKIAISAGTILTNEMLVAGENESANDVRLQEYNMIQMPTQIETGDVIDVRLMLPSGEDFIVVSKKEVEIPIIGGIDSANTLWIKLDESETLAMSNAIVEAYRLKGARLYTTKYTEPGLQDKATATYVPSDAVKLLMNRDPNILQTAKNDLFNRYNATGENRTSVNNALGTVDADTQQSNLESGISDQVTRAKEERQKYLDGLSMQ